MSKSRRRRARELVEELVSLGYQFYPPKHSLSHGEMQVENEHRTAPELKFALDKKKRIQFGIPRSQGLGYEIHPTEKLQRVLDKLEVGTFSPDAYNINVKIRMPQTGVEVPKSWFIGRFSHRMVFSSRRGVRRWLKYVKHYLLEMNEISRD